MQNLSFWCAKRSVSRAETDRFTSWNGPFCILKPTVSQRQMACISNGLTINAVRRRKEMQRNANYYYIIVLPVFYLSRATQKYIMMAGEGMSWRVCPPMIWTQKHIMLANEGMSWRVRPPMIWTQKHIMLADEGMSWRVRSPMIRTQKYIMMAEEGAIHSGAISYYAF